MKSKSKKWYILAYDIRNPKRLQRTWYFVKKKGVSLQRSVFLLQGDRNDLADLKSGIRQRTKDKEDDVRIYPVRHPGVIWAAGRQADKISILYAPVPSGKTVGLLGKISQLFSGKRK
ncbi:MAG: CRISPR-associated endonuclease Cas2 [Desulfocapsa sp.]|nr:MAG: CRISPR-associated endonuclease Cas2 [Desulfocapsa sp.]